jgi:uncharacterized protein (DUF885 family)
MSIPRSSALGAAAAVLGFWLQTAVGDPTAASSLPAASPATVASPAMAAGTTTAAAEALAKVFDDYFEASLVLNPVQATSIGDNRYNDRFEVDIGPAWLARAEKLTRDSLAALIALDRAQLSERDQLSYDIFKSARKREMEGYQYPAQLLPFDQFESTPNDFVQLGSGDSLQPFKTVKDYDDFLKRIDGFVAWSDQAIVNMREGIAEGYTNPRVLMERTLPQLEAQVVADPQQSLFWGPIKNLPASFSAADRERLTAAYRAAIETKLVPTYRRLHDFVRDEYLQKCRTTVGLDALPNGRAWYAYNVRNITTTGYTPAQIHEIGLKEVARIQGEIDLVMRQVGFNGDRKAFFRFIEADPQFFWKTREDLIAGYVAIKNRVDPALPRLFEVLPKADYEVRAIEPFREKSGPRGQYQAASEDGSRPGVFYANAYDLKARPRWAMEALSLHEGNPGHHFQVTIQREQQDLPKFRRFGGYTAYEEGWGLYAESLGRELGMYQDPYQYFGMLEGELWRSIRLVVDTGLHSKGWTRAQVLAYMEANSFRAEVVRVAETERYMAIPGQALAYKVGQLKIRELRTRAETALGDRFDVRKFHTAVLADGALPLDVLEAKIVRWIAAQPR